MARLSERMKLKKKMKRRLNLSLRGRAEIARYSKQGELLGIIGPKFNTITAEGFDEFLLNIAGTSSKDNNGQGPHLDANNASVGINNSATPGSYVFTQEGTDVGPGPGTTTKSSPTYAMTWEWWDISANTYVNANWMHVTYGDPTALGGIEGEYAFSAVEISAGNKPNDENWLYRYTLELYSSDTDFTDAGLLNLMNLFTGDLATHLTSAGIRLRPTSGAGSGSELSGSDATPDSNPSVDTGDDDITWVWTIADGTFNGTWAGTKIKIGSTFTTDLRWGGCKTDGTSCGTKSSGEEWEYTYIISVAQGS
jgi:hypothetical protein